MQFSEHVIMTYYNLIFCFVFHHCIILLVIYFIMKLCISICHFIFHYADTTLYMTLSEIVCIHENFQGGFLSNQIDQPWQFTEGPVLVLRVGGIGQNFERYSGFYENIRRKARF